MIKNLDKAILSGIIFSVFIGISGYSVGMIYGNSISEKNMNQDLQVHSIPEKKNEDGINTENSNSKVGSTTASSDTKPSKVTPSSTIPVRNNKATDRNSDGSSGSGFLSDSKPSIPSKLKDGVYYGESKGYAGLVKVRVKVLNGKINDISVVSHNETPDYYKRASTVIDKIKSAQSTGVDSVSGATLTSNAIKNAVAQALRNAGENSHSTTGTSDTIGATNSSVVEISKKVEELKKKLREMQRIDVSNFDLSQAKDGIYEGEGSGFKGTVKVSVKIENGKIKEITVLSHGDDEPYFGNARKVASDIIEKQNLSVSVVSGATFSSEGIKSAVKDALKKSGAVIGSHDKNSDTIKKKVDELLKKNKQLDEEIKDTKKLLEKKLLELKRSDSSKDDNSSINTKMKSGTYIGVGQGFKGEITVSVTIRDDRIEKIEIVSHSDDKPFFDKALSMISDMISNNTAEVDVITDATYSSKGIKKAVEDAIRQAKEARENDRNKINDRFQESIDEFKKEIDTLKKEKDKLKKEKESIISEELIIDKEKNDLKKDDDVLKGIIRESKKTLEEFISDTFALNSASGSVTVGDEDFHSK